MPKKLGSVNLNKNCLNLIVNYCEKEDISEAAFSRKFGKNNGWITDMRRSKNMNLPSREFAVKMCLTLDVTPDAILMSEGNTPDETAKYLEDIAAVQKLVDAEGAKKAPATEGEGSDGKIAQFIRSASAEELDEICRYIDFLESKRAKK